jgi:hypothetical protein
MYQSVLGASTTVAGATVAALPATGGSRSVVNYAGIASAVFGVGMLVSAAARYVAKRNSA